MKRFVKMSIAACVIGVVWYLSASASEEDETVSEKTIVHEITLFEDCGHEEKNEFRIPADAANRSPDKAAKKLGGSLVKYEKDVIIIQKKDSSCCKNHYRLFLDGNKIKTEVKRTGEIISEYPTVPSQFSENDLKLLKAGITVDSKAGLSALIEDFTS